VIAKVGGDDRRASAVADDIGAQVFGCRAGAVDVDCDRIAGPRKSHHDGAADASRPAGDEGGGRWRGGGSGRHGGVFAQIIRLGNPRGGSDRIGTRPIAGGLPTQPNIPEAEHT
jgi:hypothetical protein